MTNADKLCLEALKRGFIKVDFRSGEVSLCRCANRRAQTQNQKGYIVFSLRLNGEHVQIKAHRAIWLAAHGSIPNDLMIDHKNRIKSDNRIKNLRLVNVAENSRNRRSYIGERNPAAKITSLVANKIKAAHPTFSYQEIACLHGVSKSLVAQIVRGELWNR